MIGRRLTLALLLVSAASVARAQQSTGLRMSGLAGVSLPVGELGVDANIGFNLGVRAEGRLSSPGWRLRGDLTWDRFSGLGGINAFSQLALTANALHQARADRWYLFGGAGLYDTRISFQNGLSRDETNLGLQFGLGLSRFAGNPNTFLEVGLTDVFVPHGTNVWFPVRFGFHF